MRAAAPAPGPSRVERQSAATGVGAVRPADGDRARAAPGHRDDDEGARRRADRLHRAHPRRRAAPHPLLVPDRRARARRTPPGRRCAAPASYSSTTKGGTQPRHALQLSRVARRGSASPPSCPGPSASSGSRSARPAVNFGVVVTSRANGRARRAEDRARRRRAPPDRLRRAAVQPEPVPAHLRRSGARGRDDPARGRRLRRRLRQPVGCARRQVLVPLLAQRLDAADRGAPERSASSAARRSSSRAPTAGRASIRPRSSSSVDGKEQHGEARGRSRCASRRRGLPRAAHAAVPDLRLPGVAEHGERRPDPAEHAHPQTTFVVT